MILAELQAHFQVQHLPRGRRQLVCRVKTKCRNMLDASFTRDYSETLAHAQACVQSDSIRCRVPTDLPLGQWQHEASQ